MKLKKILAQSLAVAMVLSSIPVSGFHVSAMENDILTSSNQGYQNIDLVTDGDNKNVTVTVGSVQPDYPGTAVLDNNMNTLWHTKWNYNCITKGENWINFKLTEAQKVAGVLYKTDSDGAKNGQVKRAKVEVSTDNGDTYTEVYRTSDTNVWSSADTQNEVLFTPVENVTDVKFTGLETYGAITGGQDNYFVKAREMRLVTIPDDVSKVTATVTNQNPDEGTAKVDVLHGSGHDSITVASGTPVIYTATPSDSTIFTGWVNESGTVVSNLTSYQVTATRDMNLTARFTKKDLLPLTEISVLASNASANSYHPSGSNTDGPASWAFDDNDARWWHTNWSGNNTDENHQGQASESNPLYIQMKFTDDTNAVVSKNVQKITYKKRTAPANNTSGAGKDYQVLVANKTSGEVTDEDFVVAASGTLDPTPNEQEIVLPYPVEATHVRLRFTSSYDSGWVTATKIKFYEGAEKSKKQIKDVSGLVQSADANMGTATSSRTKTIQDFIVDTQLTATPAENCKFVKWIVTDQDGAVVSEIEEQNPTVQMDGNHTYTAMFAKVNEVSIALSDTYVSMNKGDKKQLTATVTDTAGTVGIDTSVVWESSNPEVVSVNETTGEITALQVTNEGGEVTITAKPNADTTKSATCTVVVNETPSTDTLNALLEEAGSMSLLVEKYTKASRMELAKVVAEIKANYPNTEETITQAETNVREAMKNLVQLYKVSVPNEDKITIKADAKENEGSDTGEKWIYVPLFADVTVTISNEVNTAEEQFAGWVYKTKTVCTNRSYKFFAIGDMTLTYTTGARTQEEVNLFCNSKYNTSIGKLSFIGKRMVPTMYKVIEHGIVITDATGWRKYENNQNAFVKKASRTKTSIAKGKANNGTYEAKLACGKNEQWYGRSYVTYTDGYTTYTMYSEISEYPQINSFE
ncbi:hypothetical protein [Ruminococcus sp. MCC718]|uniref:InlB B-repeat-containing protein n=1 Tax=Clostridia TaxID=186801 RepID=UPI001C03052A|nr:hypothetical protein [Ruminococcus sp. MCC718]